MTLSSSILIARDSLERLISNSSAPIKDRQGRSYGAILFFQDITQDRKNEEERIKISKLESISSLAGGIAHDFNNNLTAVLGFVNLARMPSQAHSTIDTYLEYAEVAGKHAINLTARLLTFSRGGAPIKSLQNMKALVEETTALVLSGANVKADLALAGDFWHAEVDRDQIVQVIQNLVINANQAMPDGGII